MRGGVEGAGDFRRMGFQPRLRALLLLHRRQPSRLHQSHENPFTNHVNMISLAHDVVSGESLSPSSCQMPG